MRRLYVVGRARNWFGICRRCLFHNVRLNRSTHTHAHANSRTVCVCVLVLDDDIGTNGINPLPGAQRLNRFDERRWHCAMAWCAVFHEPWTHVRRAGGQGTIAPTYDLAQYVLEMRAQFNATHSFNPYKGRWCDTGSHLSILHIEQSLFAVE